jgi:hypothetical protein
MHLNDAVSTEEILMSRSSSGWTQFEVLTLKTKEHQGMAVRGQAFELSTLRIRSTVFVSLLHLGKVAETLGPEGRSCEYIRHTSVVPTGWTLPARVGSTAPVVYTS